MKHHTPIAAIRIKCLDCCVYQPKEVRLCPVTDCTLHPYRFGRNPNRHIGKTHDFEIQIGKGIPNHPLDEIAQKSLAERPISRKESIVEGVTEIESGGLNQGFNPKGGTK